MALLALLPILDAGAQEVGDGGSLPSSALVRTQVYGESLGGRPLRAVVVMAGEPSLRDRQGLLVVGTLDGRRVGDHRVLAAALERVLATDGLAERLGDRALVFVPVANPDGLALETLGSNRGPLPVEGNRRSDDADRDGRVDEDGPADLDGDGRITWMRVPDGKGEWVIDEHDPRAMRKAKVERGERGTHTLRREGVDDDRDGAWHEDDAGGVILNENFPHGWDEHSARAGAYPLSEPESRALVDLVLRHPGLLGVVVLGEEDTLGSLPPKAKKVDKGGFGGFRSPLDGVLEADVKTLEEIQRRFKEVGEHEHDVEGDGPQAGGFLAWAYHQAGRWPLALRPWATPEKIEKPEPEEGDDADEDDDKGDDKGDKKGDKKKDKNEDGPTSDKDSPVSAAVLSWLDVHREGAGIAAWTPFEHPELGSIEIGGLTEEAVLTAGRQTDDVQALAEKLGDTLVEALDWMPALALEDVEMTDHGDGLYTVELALVNTGVLPTCPQFAADARIARPIRVRLQLPPGVERLNGPAQVLVDRLDGGGGRREFRWLIGGANAGTSLTLSADADTVPSLSEEIVLP